MSITSLVSEVIQPHQGAGASLGGGVKPEATTPAANFEALARYIPTEVLTLYIATASAMDALKTQFSSISAEASYWFFLLLTPCVFMLALLGQRKRAGLHVIPAISDVPFWRLIASTIAFAVWALAVPSTPYLTGITGGAVAALLATFISVFLSMLEPVFEK